MAEIIPDKNIQVDGKTVGVNSTIKLSAKTALWIMGGIIGIVMTILSYSYVDLKNDVKSTQSEFIEKVNENVEKMESNIQDIRIDQATIKGDIKLILDRQTRDNPVERTNTPVESILPPE
jgi:hypothetical protein